MTSDISPVALRGSGLRDVISIWLVVTAVLMYLDVPLQHSLLLAANVALQASLGGVVIVRLLSGVEPSLLLLCGPGLILGSTLSFVIFQVVGRGALGVLATAGIGIGATLLLVRMRLTNLSLTSRWWLLGQLVGMAMLALATEFTELLPVAAALFVLGFVNSQGSRFSGWLKSLINVSALAALCLLAPMRAEYWWLVTDDYQLLEVISNHLTTAGPFAAWGVDSFARYHWLSYGWSGLLNVASGSPAPLVTLTRVMPFLYSVSMASSIALLLVRLTRRGSLRWSILPAWFVVAAGRFDWSGTSTGGAYATLAAFLVVSVMVLQSRTRPLRALVVLLMLALVVALTKLPSVFVVGLLVITGLTATITSPLKRAWARLAVTIFGSVATISALLAGVWIFGRLLDERVRIVTINPALGQLSFMGRPFVASSLILNQLWLWLGVLVLVTRAIRLSRANRTLEVWFAQICLAAVFAGLLFELILTASTDNHTYFSGPMYFVSSLGLVFVAGNELSPSGVDDGGGRSTVFVTTALLLGGALWGADRVAESLWRFVLSTLSSDVELKVELLKFLTGDRRFGATLIAGLVIALTFWVLPSRLVVVGLVFSVTVLSIGRILPQTLADFQKQVPESEVTAFLGSEDERAVGNWLEKNTDASAFVATNHLFGENGGTVADLALAVWSRREFLVLGPRLGYGTTPARDEVILLSRAFAERPDPDLCARLRARKVEWFVIDQTLVKQRDWSTCAVTKFESGDFRVLSLSAVSE